MFTCLFSRFISSELLKLFIFAAAVVLISNHFSIESITRILVPLIICLLLVPIYSFALFLRFLLFFAISITSLLGLSEILTGSHSESANPFLYGLSFYTASLAAYAATCKPYNYLDALKVANPLLLMTGPIALFVEKRNIPLSKRVNYYLPYVLLGFFLFRIVATPLTEFFFLIDATDIVSSLLFALIFELFIYTNFCGLSLLIYGTFGVLDYRIPLNFRQPFSSTNILGFWKSWHTSLSGCLKVLFYNPLRTRYSSNVAIFAVFLGSALWHGVSLNFLLWGVLHALIFITSIYFLKRSHKTIPFFLLILGVVLGRLLFLDSDTERLFEKLLFRFDGFASLEWLSVASSTSHVALVFAFILVGIEFFMRKHKYVRKKNYKHLRTPIALSVITVLSILLAANVVIEYAVYGQR